MNELIAKYDIPAPRYTSYPTVPYWSENPTENEWVDSIKKSLHNNDSSVSIYIHIPFCETLCTFCGCNTTITKNHEVEEPYISVVLKEFFLYLKRVPEIAERPLKEFHLGGGSPTYLSETHLNDLISPMLKNLNIAKDFSFSIEVDPRRTRKYQLEILRELGFKRISLGVQDFEPEVQRLINRNQPYESTKRITDDARSLGYDSVNFDLIYGLPKQTLASMEDTINKTIELKPDRIAFYSYAHVPWIKGAQRLFTEDDLPRGTEKRALYELGRKKLEDAGYKEIGMDHFALVSDNLWNALQYKKLHRNFMGYTEQRTDLLLGLGVSSISDSWYSFHQNEKILKKYEKIIQSGELATLRGHKLNEEDLNLRKLILTLSTTWTVEVPLEFKESAQSYLSEMEKDGLILWENDRLTIQPEGKPFLRNVCMAFDMRLRRKSPETRVFSSAI